MPIVPVAKRDGNIWICGDYKVTFNQALRPEVYQIEELFTALAGGISLDLSHAYQQLVLDKNFALVSYHQYS